MLCILATVVVLLPVVVLAPMEWSNTPDQEDRAWQEEVLEDWFDNY